MTTELAHLALFVGGTDPLSGRPHYRLAIACGFLPDQGVVVTTAHVDVTCPKCLVSIEPASPATRSRLRRPRS